jgi:hypothetical protein
MAGTVQGTVFGSLSMLQLPGDDFVTIELVHDPVRGRIISCPEPPAAWLPPGRRRPPGTRR